MANANQMIVKVRTRGNPNAMPRVIDKLRNMEGIDDLVYQDNQQLRITYDVTRTGWNQIRHLLHTGGIYSEHGMLARLREGFRNFKEQNIRDNLNYKPACCSKPPAGAGRR